MKHFLTSILICLSLHSSASHIAAGEMYYDYLGNNNYEINVLLYRDCGGTAFDPLLNLTVFSGPFNSIYQVISIPLDTANIELVDYSAVTTPSCLSQFPGACLEYYTYSAVVNLPPINGGYLFSYQRCCLSAQITNILTPDFLGFTFTCKIPGLETGQYENNSPRFQGHSLFLSCINELINFNHVGFDPDGDSLVYSLITPVGYDWGSSNIADPNPELAPPYFDLPYEPSFSAQSPLGAGAVLSIDSTSGMMTVEPVLVGQFVIGVKVDEFKSGIMVNSTYRNLLMQTAISDAGLEPNSALNDFSISPNPASNEVIIHSETEHSLIIFTSEGKRIYQGEINQNGEYSLDVSSFESGVYYFQFNSAFGQVTKLVYR